MGAQYKLQQRVAVITLDNPPVNGLNADTRRELLAGLDRANADGECDAIVITGAGSLFSAGADIREFGTPRASREPTLFTLIGAIEQSAKPVVAAINGTCMGGGLELSLGCHYRVATAKASIALPEVKLGLLPGAGGTQRLPRAVGIETALNMIVTGAAVPAAKLASSGLFDAVTEGGAPDAAIALAQRVVAEKRPNRRLRDVTIEDANAEGYFAFARNTVAAVARNFPAPRKCIDAIAGAVSLPFDEGLRNERRLFLELMQTPESRALRHAFFAERAASRVEGLEDATPVRKVERVAVIGAGTMGAGIAMNFLSAGIPVTLVEMNDAALQKGVATLRGNYEASAKKGRITGEKVAQCMSLLTATTDDGGVRDADLVIEAVFEDMEVKQQVFARLDAIAKPGAIIATNTSTLDVDRLAASTNRPQDVLGMHFFSPANVMKLLEVVRGKDTAPDVLKTVMQIAKRIGKTAVVAGVCDGFIGNRML
ncbi:MAG TPA: 3-hydroxyacyl-CoA dehydrogenase NAD-binding domain-containing protein, partial [Casimicrobiaceae bacterium]|nr:3-hydroxyacyl-CoA dehydrogenase NAD-binding domain-containing protein [Casimicrobiaceae bacterium]